MGHRTEETCRIGRAVSGWVGLFGVGESAGLGVELTEVVTHRFLSIARPPQMHKLVRRCLVTLEPPFDYVEERTAVDHSLQEDPAATDG